MDDLELANPAIGVTVSREWVEAATLHSALRSAIYAASSEGFYTDADFDTDSFLDYLRGAGYTIVKAS